jgi:chromosome segregation ATPase
MGRSELDASSTSLADTSKQDWQSALATLAKTLEEKSKGSPQIEAVRASEPCQCAQLLLNSEREDVRALKAKNAELEARKQQLEDQNTELTRRMETSQKSFQDLLNHGSQERMRLEGTNEELQKEIVDLQAELTQGRNAIEEVKALKEQILLISRGCDKDQLVLELQEEKKQLVKICAAYKAAAERAMSCQSRAISHNFASGGPMLSQRGESGFEGPMFVTNLKFEHNLASEGPRLSQSRELGFEGPMLSQRGCQQTQS